MKQPKTRRRLVQLKAPVGTRDLPAKPVEGELALAWQAMFGQQIPAYNPSVLVTRKGLELFDAMKRDDQVKAAVNFKKLAAFVTGWEVTSPEGQEQDWEPTKFLAYALDHIDGSFLDSLLDGPLSAIEYGYSVTEMVFEPYQEGPFKGKIGLKALKPRRPHDFGFELDQHGNILPNGLAQYTTLKGTLRLPVWKFIIFSHQQEFGNPYGKSDLEACYRAYWIKENAYRWLAMLLERFGIPPVFALYDPTTMTPGQVTQLLTAIDRIQAATAGAIPRTGGQAALELWSPELAGQTTQVFIPALEMLNKDIARALLMPDLIGTTPEGRQGSYARAKVHFDVFMLMVSRLRQQIEDVIVMDQIVRPLIRFNYDTTEFPVFRFMPMTDNLRMDVMQQWGDFVQLGVVKSSPDDEAHIRGSFGFPTRKPSPDEGKAVPGGQPSPGVPNDGEEGPDGSEGPEGEEEETPEPSAGFESYAGFKPDQPRDEEGKWGGEGGGGVGGSVGVDVEDKGHWEKWVEALPGGVQQDLIGYTASGYEITNALLRGRPIPKSSLPKTVVKKIAEKQISSIDNAFTQIPTVKSDVTVYRGMSLTAFGGEVPKKGMEFSDKGFVSTSADKSIAEHFLTLGPKRVMTEIRVPKGSKVISIGSAGISRFPEEKEVLFNRNSKFKVVDVISQKSGTRVIVEPVAPPGIFSLDSSSPFVEVTFDSNVSSSDRSSKFVWDVGTIQIIKKDQSYAGFKPDQPRDESGKWGSGGIGGGGVGGGLELEPTTQRAFTGATVETKTSLSKLETGEIGEQIGIAYLKSKGFKDAAKLNVKVNNFPVDVIHDHEVMEVKAGLVSNGRSAQQWRATIGQPGPKEQAWLKTASAEDKAAWNSAKAKEIINRKTQAVAKFSKEQGVKVAPKTLTTIINPDTQTADVYIFKGFHSRIAWNSPEAKAAYVGSFKYKKSVKLAETDDPKNYGGFKPDQPRDESGRWGSGGGSSPGAGEKGGEFIGRSDGTGFISDADRTYAQETVAGFDKALGDLRSRFPGLKKLSVDHVHVHNADGILDSKGKQQSGVLGEYLGGRVDVAVGGMHRGERDGITLGSWNATSGKGGTFLHEVGHHAHDTVLSQSAQKEWLGVWRQYQGSALPGKVSQYGASSHRELFAESFAVFTSPGYGKNLPEPYHAFMMKHIAKKKG